jgi:galactokinase
MADFSVGVGNGRLDFMGGVGDYSGGLVLQVATARCTTVRARVVEGAADAEGTALMRSAQFGSVSLSLSVLRAAAEKPAALELPAVRAFLNAASAPGWAFYVYGSLAVFFRETGWLPSASQTLELEMDSTVPPGQGVSSSASVEVATVRALFALAGAAVAPIPQLRVAHIAQNAENYVVGAPCGLMDQLASALGAPGRVLPILCRPDCVGPAVPLPDSLTVVGWPSGVKHSVAASPYLTARTATFMGKKVLERVLGRSLVHVTELSPSSLTLVEGQVPVSMTGAEFIAEYGSVDDGLSRVLPDTVYPVRAALTFPVHESFRCGLALSLLRALGAAPPSSAEYTEGWTRVGELLYQAHRGYASIGLGCPETDDMIAALAELGPGAGVYGARISGGGSGGTVAVLCERTAVPAVEALAARLTFGEPFPGLIS